MESLPELSLFGLATDTLALGLATLVVLLIFAVVHFTSRHVIARHIIQTLKKESSYHAIGDMASAFRKNTRFWRSMMFRSNPVGWSKATAKRLEGVRISSDQFIQELNDRYVTPSGTPGERKSSL